MTGLRRKHHGELNRMNVPSTRYDDLRYEYADNPLALEQIDIYDPSSQHVPLMRAYRDALKTRDEEAVATSLDALKREYPLTSG